MAPYHYRGCPCSQCWKRQNRLAQRLVNVVGVMSQQPNYSQLAMSEDSWDPISKAAAASVALNAFNGYPRQTALPNVGYPAPGSNGGHYPAGPQSHAPQLSPTAGGRGNGSSGTVAQHWHGIRLPTAPSSSSGTITATADGWLSAALPQNISGMNPSSTVITPSSNAAAAAAAAAQAYSGNTTSYFATGGGEAGISHPSVLPPTRPPPPAGQTAPAVLSPTSPMISPTAPLATVWPQSSHSDSILPGQHNHRFQLPQQNHQSEQRSPQRHQHQHSVGLVHGLNDKTLPHYQQHPAHTHQQYPNFGTATGSANSPTMAAVSYEKLLEAVAIQAARVPFFNQQTSLGSHHHQIEPQRTDGTENQQSSIMELDILRNLAATAGNASSGYTNASHHGPRNQQEQQQPGGVLGTNGYGRSSFRPPVTIKQEPSYTSITPPGTIATPSSDLDVAHTMLSIQTCSIQNTVPEYQQISPPADAPQPETKYQPPSSTNSNSAMSPRKGSSGGGDNDEERKAYAAAITVETSQSDTYGESGQQPMAKRLKISTSTEDVSKSNEEDPIGTGDNADSDHSNANAQGEQAKNDNENGRDHSDTAKKTPTPPTSCSGGFGEDVSPVVSRSSPSNDTPLSVGGRTDSSSENDSPSGVGAAATATAVSFVRSNILVPTLSSENSSPVAATVTTSAATTNPPGHFPPTPFGAFAGQQHSGNYTNLHTCHICGFSSPSKFHFNSHMNTHADHKCDYCDYTSRTEGRLKRHMKEFHSPPHTSTANSNDESSSHGGGHNAGGNSSFDQSLEEQLQAVVANMTSGAGAGAMGNITKTPPPSKASTSGSGNKMKTYRCKQCEFVAKSKDDYWAHSRTHIKSDKLLVCPNCPFVTEYKHHLEYHLRNHFGSKPFKCVKCNYSCVNKSMLNSHMKSHSNVYQYRCTDCTYATKYCHSLKLHLRKYGHTAATTVTTEGSTLVDGMSIDVYGNRRGPRSKKSSGGGDNASTSSAEGNRTSVTTGGPLSASLPLASPSYLRTSAPSALEESLNQQRATAIVTPGGTGVVSTTPSFVEAFQSSLMAQQQKDLTAAMVTSIATLGAQLPTVPSLAAVIAAAQNRPGPPSTLPMGGMPNTEPVSPGPGPLLSTGHMGPACVLSSTLQMTSPPANAQPPQLLKCNLCEFACVSKEALTKHTMIHMIEKPEQFYHVLMASAAAQAQAVAAAAAAYANTSQQSVSGGSSCESTPAMADMGMGREMTTHMGGGAYGDGESDEQIGGRLQDASQDSGGSPCSVSGGKASGDEGIGNESLAGASTLSGGPSGQHRQRRKGKAFKLDRIALKLQGKECEEEENETTAGVGGEGDNENIAGGYDKIGTRHTRSTSPAGACYSGQSESGFRVNRSESVSSVGEGRPRVQRGNTRDESQPHVNAQQRKPSSSVYPSPMGRPTNIDWSNAYVCNYCEIAFKDCIMYTMHMGFHGYQDPYKCNTCGHVSDDARSMFLHIAREPHL